MKKKFWIVGLLLLFLVTGCVKKTVDPTPPEDKVERPVADGEAFTAKELDFYLPEEFGKSPTNGMLGVYEFYTGELKNAGPTGIDVMILVDLMDEDFVLEDYLQNESLASKNEVTLKKKTFNDVEWYVGQLDTTYYYYATFHGYHYDIEIRKIDDPNNLYDSAVKMFEKTLFFEELEEK